MRLEQLVVDVALGGSTVPGESRTFGPFDYSQSHMGSGRIPERFRRGPQREAALIATCGDLQWTKKTDILLSSAH